MLKNQKRDEKRLKSAQKSINKSEKQAIGTSAVADMIFKIYNTTNPKTRYTIIKNKPIIKLVSWLPPK